MRTLQLIVTVGILSLVLSPTPQALAQCGNCDGNGMTPDILDALTAAQIAAGIRTADPRQERECDVDGDFSITNADARLIAEFAAGLSVTLTCPVHMTLDPAAGYCVTEDLVVGGDWQIVVRDTDPYSGVSFAIPPAGPEVQVATVNSPWPTTDPSFTLAAFRTAVNGTQPFGDAVFGSTGSPISGSCFLAFARDTVAGLTHLASVGILYSNGTTCFPPIGGSCPFNPPQ